MGPMVSSLPACYIVHSLQLLSYGNVGREGEWERGEGGGEGERERETNCATKKGVPPLPSPYIPLLFCLNSQVLLCMNHAQLSPRA